MRIGAAFPSEYLKAADLGGRTVTVKISHVSIEEIGGEHKPVLHVQGSTGIKKMVLNKTNAHTLSTAYGDETDDWTGQPVTLFEAQVDFQGKTVPAIRVKVPPRPRIDAPPQARHAEPAPMPATANGSDHRADLHDEIPF